MLLTLLIFFLLSISEVLINTCQEVKTLSNQLKEREQQMILEKCTLEFKKSVLQMDFTLCLQESNSVEFVLKTLEKEIFEMEESLKNSEIRHEKAKECVEMAEKVFPVLPLTNAIGSGLLLGLKIGLSGPVAPITAGT